MFIPLLGPSRTFSSTINAMKYSTSSGRHRPKTDPVYSCCRSSNLCTCLCNLPVVSHSTSHCNEYVSNAASIVMIVSPPIMLPRQMESTPHRLKKPRLIVCCTYCGLVCASEIIPSFQTPFCIGSPSRMRTREGRTTTGFQTSFHGGLERVCCSTSVARAYVPILPVSCRL